jgi:transcription initiation factor TFIIE subunit alpha
MYLSNKVIESVIAENIGEEYLPLVRILKGKKEMSELKLAGIINKNINVTRSMLYKLASSNLVASRKVKDKKKGWCVYYWSLKHSSIKYLAKISKENYLKKLSVELKKEQNLDFFACPSVCYRVSYEKALDLNFKCPECGELMYKEDNTSRIELIIKEIKRINDSAKYGAIKT